MAKAPAFQFYADKWLTGTMTMTLAESGAYITLLAYQWEHGSVPADPAARQRLLGCRPAEERRIWPAVALKFDRRADGALVNPRLETERQKQADHREKSRRGGQASANQRANQTPTKGSTQPQPNGQPSRNTTSSSSFSSTYVRTGASQPDAPKPHPIRDVLTRYEQLYEAKVGEPPARQRGKDAKILKGLIDQFGFEKVVVRLEAMFCSSDEWLRQTGYTIGVFKSQWNKLATAEKSFRTSSNMRGIQGWLDKRLGEIASGSAGSPS